MAIKFIEQRRIGALGRIGIPRAARIVAGIDERTRFNVFVDTDDDSLILRPVRDRESDPDSEVRPVS